MAYTYGNTQNAAERIKEISGVNPLKCMKCGKCSATCPAFNEMDIKPHQFVTYVQNGDIEALAQASGFVKSKPEGLNTMVSQGGANLSGGQRQRLTIARALVGDPEILIMDDSASALDFATDAALRHAIHEQTKGMTVFIVSQRATSIKQADKILVLDDGELAGVGTHKELMESCEVYREICLSQLSEQEVNR